MRTIRKDVEPHSLTGHRLAEGANYENYRQKEALRESVFREQRGLCCYCMSRIRPQWSAMKIAQTNHLDEQLIYSNLLGACMGDDGKRNADYHCDTSKRDRDLSRNPANADHHVEDVIRFLGDGTIESTDPVFDRELNDVLNLNLAFLRNSRKAVLDAFQAGMSRRGALPREVIRKWLADWNGETDTGQLRPYCQVVVYWLRKRLDRPAS